MRSLDRKLLLYRSPVISCFDGGERTGEAKRKEDRNERRRKRGMRGGQRKWQARRGRRGGDRKSVV